MEENNNTGFTRKKNEVHYTYDDDEFSYGNSDKSDSDFQDDQNDHEDSDYEFTRKNSYKKNKDKKPHSERIRIRKSKTDNSYSDNEDQSFHLNFKNDTYSSLASHREKRIVKSKSYVDDLPAELLDDMKGDDSDVFTVEPLSENQLPSVERIIGFYEEKNIYYVKLSKYPECESSYLTAEEIVKYPVGQSHLDSFNAELEEYGSKYSIFIPFFIIPANWEEDEDRAIDRVIAYDQEHDLYLVKWLDSNYDQCSWVRSPEPNAVEEFYQRQQRPRYYPQRMAFIPYYNPPSQSQSHSELSSIQTEDETDINLDNSTNFNLNSSNSLNSMNNINDDSNNNDNIENQELNSRPLTTKFLPPPTYKNGNTLRSYQIEALNWMRAGYCAKSNLILADEMGLGKTIMCIAMLEEVVKHAHIHGPFLIVAPLGTLPNWQREFAAWTDLNCICFHGSSQAREVMKLYELFYPPPFDSNLKAQVVLTNMETVLKEYDLLRSIKWHFVIIDEAHKLKNMNSKAYKMMSTLQMEHILLMTGTPIQNNLDEIFALLHFIEPKKFPALIPFKEKYHNIQTADDVEELRKTLKGYMLRRKKRDVDCLIASKEETLVEVELTRPQKLYYRMLLDSKRTELEGKSYSKVLTLNNLAMQLRKVCNHPFLVQGAEETIIKPDDNRLEVLISASGKMIFVDKLLRKLKQQNEKVLIFSQMVRVLNLLEEFLVYRNYKFVRLDGRVTGDKRQIAIDEFNDPTGDVFAFLLCTKAGGVGLNLTAATNVIIYDSDWNPQNDVQAQSRCHRIGQTKDVKVYRLITRGTYESEMFSRASLKLGLDQAILDSNTNGEEMSSKDIEVLIKKGAYHVYNDDETEADKFVTEDIDEILKHRSKTVTKDGQQTNSMFSTASFIISGSGEQVDINDAHFWDKIDPRSYEERKEDERSLSLDEEDDDRTRWNISKRDRLVTALTSFGWGAWHAISSALRPASDSAVEDACHAILNIIAQHVADPISFIKFLTHKDSLPLTTRQRKMLNSEPFGQRSWQSSIASKASYYEHRLIVLQTVRNFVQNLPQQLIKRDHYIIAQTSPPDIGEREQETMEQIMGDLTFTKPSDITKIYRIKPKTYPLSDWQPEDDEKLLEAVLRHGWSVNGIQNALNDQTLWPIKERVVDKKVKPFLNRFIVISESLLSNTKIEEEVSQFSALRQMPPSVLRQVLYVLSETGGVFEKLYELPSLEPFYLDIPQNPEDELAAFENIDDPESSENNQQFIPEFTPEMREQQRVFCNELGKILIGALKITNALSGKADFLKLKDYFKTYCSDLAKYSNVFTVQLAERAIANLEWLTRLRSLNSQNYLTDEGFMETNAAGPDWWTPDHTIAVFQHLISNGFADISDTLQKEPFTGCISDEDLEYAVNYELRKKRNGSTRNAKGDLSFLLVESELIQWAENVISQLGGWPSSVPRKVFVPDFGVKFLLPYLEGPIIVESLGDGDFGVTENGYLYRCGFRAKSSFNRQRFICDISSEGQFVLQRGKNSYIGTDLEELFYQAGAERYEFGNEAAFGIGSRIIQYQYHSLYTQYGSGDLDSYVPPDFELFVMPKPAQKPKKEIKKDIKTKTLSSKKNQLKTKRNGKKRKDWEDSDDDDQDFSNDDEYDIYS